MRDLRLLGARRSSRKGGFERADFYVTIDSPNPSEEVKNCRWASGMRRFVTFTRAAASI